MAIENAQADGRPRGKDEELKEVSTLSMNVMEWLKIT